MSKGKKYYTTGDIARYCEVDVNTVKNWIRNGNLRAFTTPSGHYRISRDRFIALIKEQGFLYDPSYFNDDSYIPDILIIDGDTNQRDSVINVLNKLYKNIRLQTASNSFDGYAKILKQRPKIILIDLAVSSITGLEFLRFVRSKDNLNDMRILVISPHGNECTLRELKELKVNAILFKPVKKQILKKKCDELMKEANKEY